MQPAAGDDVAAAPAAAQPPLPQRPFGPGLEGLAAAYKRASLGPWAEGLAPAAAAEGQVPCTGLYSPPRAVLAFTAMRQSSMHVLLRQCLDLALCKQCRLLHPLVTWILEQSAASHAQDAAAASGAQRERPPSGAAPKGSTARSNSSSGSRAEGGGGSGTGYQPGPPLAVVEAWLSGASFTLPWDQNPGTAQRFTELWAKAFREARMPVD